MPRRSIIITFGDNDPVITSDLSFIQKLNDLRERYPSWHIRGMVHDDDRPSFLPQRPSTRQATPPPMGPDALKNVPAAADEDAVGTVAKAVPMDWHDGVAGSDESDGEYANAVGHHPVCVQVGLRVKLLVPPYEGLEGSVAEVTQGRFRVVVDAQPGAALPPGTCAWWCVSDDVLVAPECSKGEEPVSLTTFEWVQALQARVAELEEEVQRLRQ